MSNLLYAEYNTGCYVGWDPSAGDYGYGVYCYGSETSMASYYADLEPNTTYTIQRIDTSTRFRIALTSTDVKYYAANSYVEVDVFSWSYRADTSNPITFTTTDTATHLVIYYTNNSEYNTRVMLNEGSSIEPYEAPTKYFKTWYLNTDDRLTHAGLPQEITGSLFQSPYPSTFWNLQSNDILTLNDEYYNYTLQPIVDESIGRNDTVMLTYPYPASFWQMVADQLTTLLLPIPINTPTLVKPYPASFWWYEIPDDRLENVLIPDELIVPPEGGAFLNAENLEYVKIPRSVTSIGWQAFQGTKLKKVCISRNCRYSRSSFPKDCEVIFYEDMYDEQYLIAVSGKNSYRYTETVTHFEDSVSQENP